jgi:glycolate oxidase FAD binding subunit
MTAVAASVVGPDTVEDLARTLADAARDLRTVRIRGGGTKSYLGDPTPTDIECLTSGNGLIGIIDHVPADLTVTVGAGTLMSYLQKALGDRGQFLPLDPPHPMATVGGVIAANSNGFWRSRYGAVRDNLIGTRVALADGTVVRAGGRVVKNVAGYDLNKLLVGSLGTLGVIVEATFKVLPLPAASDGIVARFARAAEAFAAAAAVCRGAARPESCVLEGGAERGWSLMVSARGAGPAVARAIADARREVAERRGKAGPPADELADLRELPARASDGGLVRVALPLAAQAPFADTAAHLESFATLVADAASGVIRAHLRGDDDAVIRDAAALLLAARMVGGAGRVERRAEHLRDRLSAWPTRPNGELLMRRIKDAFDPSGMLEPGRSAVA